MKVQLIKDKTWVEVVESFTTYINGYKSPAYRLVDGSTVVKAQIMDVTPL